MLRSGFGLLDQVPVWAGGVVFFALLMIALEIGYRVGVSQRERWHNAEAGGGALVLTSVLALLGLMLAFTFADGIGHYKSRKQAVIAEANALGTAFLRADMVGEPGRSAIKRALLDYAQSRAVDPGMVYSPERAEQMIGESSRMVQRLWPIVLEILEQREPGAIEASLVAAVNEVIDLHTARNMAVFDRLPLVVLLLLLFITASSLAIAGFNAGLSGRMSRWRMIIFALVLTGIVYVIQDFDRPVDGFILVAHDSLHQLIEEMEAALDDSG